MTKPHLITGRFQINESDTALIGRGGMGEVYRGTDIQTGQPVAIKVLKPGLTAQNPQVVERFVREGEALRQLNHPNIVQILATAEENGQHYLVMEYVPGGDLTHLLKAEPQLPLPRLLQIALELADALSRAHHLGIIHHDLKPANVLLAEDSTPRLTDFGVARLANTPQLTQTGMVIGTLDYLSPEACDGAPADRGTDIWAFGVLLYEMLAGRRPFQGETTAATLVAILMETVPDLAQFRTGIPDALTDLVYRLLEKEPRQRMPSMRLVGAELEAILEDRSLVAGHSPPPETIDRQAHLFEAITPATPSTSKHNLSLQPTPLVGRIAEQAELAQRLAEPEQRLITILGPGGMGKSRLALAVAEAHLAHFADGVFFVPLASLDSPEAIVPTLAKALNFSFYEGGPPQQQLFDYLRQKTMLLILDNFEHLLASVTLVAEILQVAPGLKILVTSRARLNLQSEQLFSLSGVTYPEQETLEDVASYDAVKLFRQSARRVQPGFELTADNQEGVIQICQLVQGLPLGIVLAAAWVTMLTPAEIVAEMKQSLDFLETDLQDMPHRQQSLRALFDYSWQLLTEAERSVFRQLSIFRGGFTREAAQAVTGASLRSLMSLVNQSLLYRASTGRYEIHELLRQYGAEKLAQSPAVNETVREQHSAYYLAFLKAREPMLTGPEQPKALAEIGLEIDNIRTGWGWAVKQGQLEAINQVVEALYHFYEIRSRYQEGEEIFAQTIAHLEQAEGLNEQPNFAIVLNRLSARRGAFYQFLGDYEAAHQYLLDSLNSAGQPSEQVFVLTMLGDVALAQAKPTIAEEHLRKSLAICREIGVLHGTAKALQGLCSTKLYFGDYAAALELAKEGLSVSRQLGQPDLVARALMALAWPTNCLGAYRESEAYWQEMLAICQKTGNQAAMATSLAFLGWVAHCRSGSDLSQAIDHYQKTLTIYRQIGDRVGIAMSLADLALVTGEAGNYELAMPYGREGLAVAKEISDINFTINNLFVLGFVTCGLSDLQTSRTYLTEALQLARKTRKAGSTMNTLFYFAVLLAKEGDLAVSHKQFDDKKKAKAIELLVIVTNHPITWQVYRDKAVFLLAELEAELPSEVVATAKAQGKTRTLEGMVTELLQIG
jgi:serine/threonine protein kinase/tetratricopeptide (TPR) repeat protein